MAETKVQTKITPPKRKKSKKKVIWIVIIVLTALIITAIVFSGGKDQAITVQTEQIRRMTITQVVTATGKIQSETEVNISAEVSGEIAALPFKEGDMVKKGDLVVRIKPDAYYPQLQQQVAGLKVQQSELKTQEINIAKLELDFNRSKDLVEKGLAPQSELDEIRANLEAAVANLNTLRARINQQKAALSSVQYDISKTTIVAPIDGTITQLNNEVGEKVLGTSFNIGTNILTISDLNNMECQVEVGETDVNQISIGDTARIQVDAIDDRILSGVVYEIGNSAQTTGVGMQDEVVNFIVKIRVLDKDVKLRPGMSCNVDIEVETKFNVLGVPIQSVTTRDNSDEDSVSTENENLTKLQSNRVNMKKPDEIVFTVKENHAKLNIVKTGISDDQYIEIIEGVSEGDEVVKGTFKAINRELEDNSLVKIDNETKTRFKQDGSE
ncbi:MAG: efflux RND transporter periplasmic adaptor subunit [Ignavibacteriaceae bacterium]|jgi:RND family efflux transporter, MFP subunit|nr:MAG: efflux RND transporter periplasmic adaptor subunit [Chlorobiota bacterium]KXK04585.1 MAG: efflux transporter, RND family, MFP subunit [Chlorobi bacterium OLB4]MBV6399407.1 Macrolide export protein MacA [Ignavibacteria bacterium]MCC6886604.1 efflux RND transporter periplasmic adaptor subunit [Ignavibacteriales bacterium]MCE7953258.1 efflux RND transporter periplasmic adaptor subunit [Chlorobi bacterium CHB7]MDL1887951.1 efflux RND transporter periplasmic adaptor subunit [Ignavibacteria 